MTHPWILCHSGHTHKIVCVLSPQRRELCSVDTHSPASDNIDLLRHVADVNGVATGFWDWYGN